MPDRPVTFDNAAERALPGSWPSLATGRSNLHRGQAVVLLLRAFSFSAVSSHFKYEPQQGCGTGARESS